MRESLQVWIEKENITLKEETEFIYSVADKYYLVLLSEKVDLFNREMFFNLDDREINLLENRDRNRVNGLLFEFGDRYYYSDVVPREISEVKDDKVIVHFKYEVQLKDFQYLGTLEPLFNLPSLGIHTEYELLNSALSINNLVKKCKFLDIKHLALCDKNTLAGTLAFQKLLEESKIKSIIGETVSVKCEDFLIYNLKLYVINKEGWINLLQINSYINVKNRSEGKFITEEQLFLHSNGLIAVFSYDNSVLTYQTSKDKYLKIVKKYKDAFFQVYQQFSLNSFEDERVDKVILGSFKIYFSEYVHILPPVYIDDVYYLEADHSNCKLVLNKIAGKSQLVSMDSYLRNSYQIADHFVTLFDLDKVYCDLSVASLFELMIQNATKIADACNFKIETGYHKLPKFRDDPNFDAVAFMREWAEQGFNEKIVASGKVSEDQFEIYLDRYEYEFKLISEAGFADYFLILADLNAYVRSQGELIGNARGSVGGSLLCYLLGIIEVDPVRFDLPFERFLSPGRLFIPKIITVETEDGTKIVFSEEDKVNTTRGLLKAIDLTEQDELILN